MIAMNIKEFLIIISLMAKECINLNHQTTVMKGSSLMDYQKVIIYDIQIIPMNLEYLPAQIQKIKTGNQNNLTRPSYNKQLFFNIN